MAYFDKDETDALSAHNEAFRTPRNEEDLLPVFFRPATREDKDAKFMTASEIHGRLKFLGNIERVMPVNKFGAMMQKMGYEQKRYNGNRGYLVVPIDTPEQLQKEIARDLMAENQDEKQGQ